MIHFGIAITEQTFHAYVRVNAMHIPWGTTWSFLIFLRPFGETVMDTYAGVGRKHLEDSQNLLLQHCDHSWHYAQESHTSFRGISSRNQTFCSRVVG